MRSELRKGQREWKEGKILNETLGGQKGRIYLHSSTSNSTVGTEPGEAAVNRRVAKIIGCKAEGKGVG